jgi:hypothetical protein
LGHHVGIAAELIVREQADGELAVGFLADRLDGFAKPDIDRMACR